jgi:hypothetical protein
VAPAVSGLTLSVIDWRFILIRVLPIAAAFFVPRPDTSAAPTGENEGR